MEAVEDTLLQLDIDELVSRVDLLASTTQIKDVRRVARRYKLRRLQKPDSKNDFDAASLAVPMEIAKNLPENMEFEPELTEEGILYRPVITSISGQSGLPSWMTAEDEDIKTEIKT